MTASYLVQIIYDTRDRSARNCLSVLNKRKLGNNTRTCPGEILPYVWGRFMTNSRAAIK